MLTALLYGLAASSALLIGAAVGVVWEPPRRLTGVLLAFASGALISALSFELFEEAFALGGATRSGLGLLAGAATFVALDSWLDRRMTSDSGPRQRDVAAGGVGLSLLAAVTLDGVPENIALGASLAGGASATLLLAVFVSNLPEALVGAVAMRSTGRSRGAVLGLWAGCGVLLAAAVVLGRLVAGSMGDDVLAVTLGFAGGAVLASLADTLLPEAFESAGPVTALATAAGFFLAFVLAA